MYLYRLVRQSVALMEADPNTAKVPRVTDLVLHQVTSLQHARLA
jgi:hypothetical protein